MSFYENDYHGFDQYIASDECGRGPLAGPVVACSVGLKKEYLNDTLKYLQDIGIRDSKKLSEKKIGEIINRLHLPSKLPSNTMHKKNFKSGHLTICVALKSNTYIDEKNILFASLEAMKISGFEVLQKVGKSKSTCWFFDGPYVSKLSPGRQSNIELIPVIKGDSKSLLIGTASVIAKYYRDEIMRQNDIIHPGYGFKKNKGYPTKDHLNAIRELGHTSIHRTTFRGVIE